MQSAVPIIRGTGETSPMIKDRRKALVDMHAFMLLTFFTPPLMLCFSMGRCADAAYFLGSWPLIAVVIPPMLFVLYIVQRQMTLPKVSLLIACLVPAALLALIGGIYRDHLLTQESAVANSDCTAFVEKRELQHAYSIGTEVLTACASQSGGLDFVETIKTCPQYREASRGYEGELEYLKDLETRFQCAGFCAGGPRLFRFVGTPAVSCRRFVLEELRGSRVQATVVLYYAIAIIILSLPLYLFAGPLLDKCYLN